MSVKALFYRLYKQTCNYNLFIPEENDYDDGQMELQDPATVLKRQKYTTWLYIILFIGNKFNSNTYNDFFFSVSLYILLYVSLLKSQSRAITITEITPMIFNQLYLDHAATLSCPCSATTIPYETFVSNTIIFHPVCSSFFISQEWIEALYLIDASTYGATDFRTTAHSQVRLVRKRLLL